MEDLLSTVQDAIMLLLNVIAGDPGLGKSQLLKAAASVSPRGIYVCGNTTTNAGLTVAVVKDSMTSDYAFEAGMHGRFICSLVDC
jgi:DNA replicative helicase MCM subunit Mcm2 (Cdc46/Mcm family)